MIGRIFHEDSEDDDDEPELTEVGHIDGYRIIGDAEDLFFWADSLNQDIHDAVVWLKGQDEDKVDFALLQGCLFVKEVEVAPEWRGKGFVLKAVASYIEIFAHGSLAFLKPAPLVPFDDPAVQKREIEKRRRFWRKLGLNNYDSEANILWEFGWNCPEWLRGEI
ncbi:MAG: hypothetical protein AAF329_24595 [Cyanobacteria bacterium P01_A01_bin.17]